MSPKRQLGTQSDPCLRFGLIDGLLMNGEIVKRSCIRSEAGMLQASTLHDLSKTGITGPSSRLPEMGYGSVGRLTAGAIRAPNFRAGPRPRSQDANIHLGSHYHRSRRTMAVDALLAPIPHLGR